ncbi:MAG: acylphosphatase [Candidatus Aenigmarchaeota archaeon]|nr:acylphosphatase [Candidatus Aenigmarchaeota archaeon]
MKTVHVLVSGIVQDVGFRYFTSKNAKNLGIGGWVQNTPDRKVEAVFQGEEADVDKMVELCRKGPSSAHVKDVRITEETNNVVYDGFKTY